MESTQEVSKKVGQAGFVPIPDLDKMRVGHAGIYEPDDDDDDIDATDVDTEVINIKELKQNGTKTMLSVEEGIKTLVEELAKDKENHLPNSRVGVYVYYLVKGVKEDFNIEFDRTPESISKKGSTRTLKAKKDKIPFLSKKDKNELLAKLTYQYYENDVNNGVITQAEAFAMMSEEAARKKMYEDKGLFLSSNKTQGVSLFDWKKAVSDANSNEDAIKIYTTNFVEVVIPNIVENFYHISGQTRANKLAKELYKSPLSLTREVLKVCSPNERSYGGMEAEAEPISTINDALTELKKRFEDKITKIEKEFIINGLHLTKIKKSGMMKPRQVCFDCKSKKDGSTHLFLLDDTGSVLHLQ